MRSKRYMRNTRNGSMLQGPLAKEGFELWNHFFWATDKENGEKKAFFIEFYRLNPLLKGEVTLTKSCFSFSMLRAGMLGGCDDHAVVAEFFSNEQTSVSKNILSLRFGDNICLEDSLVGNIIHDSKGIGARFNFCEGGSISWDLSVSKPIHYSLGAAASFVVRALNIVRMYWHISGFKAKYNGRISVNNREFTVDSESCCGYQDKTWGNLFSKEWFKLYGGSLYIDHKLVNHSALVVARGEPQLLNWSLGKRYFIMLSHEGQMYDFSYLSKHHSSCQLDHLNENNNSIRLVITATNATHRIEIVLKIEQDAVTTVNYPTPQHGSLPLINYSKVEGVVNLYSRSETLIDWHQILSFTLLNALIQSNKLIKEPTKGDGIKD